MNKEYYYDIERLTSIFEKCVGKMLQWTAADIRSKAKSSMKAANTGRVKKRGSHSSPGQAPFTHRGTIKALLKYAINKSDMMAIIGPESLPRRKTGNKSVPAILERGGVFEIVQRISKPMETRKFSPESERDKNVNEYEEMRSNRPDRINQTYSKRYRYFYSKNRWKAASESASFKAWGRIQRFIDKPASVPVKSRPFMVAAMRTVMAEENMAKKLERAMKGR